MKQIFFGLLAGMIFCSAALAKDPPLLDSPRQIEQNSYFRRIQKAPSEGILKERLKAAYLLSRMRHSPLTFIRNGKEYKGHEAAAHLEKKYRYGYNQGSTIRDFIEGIASKSSFSNKPYMLRLKNGTVVPTRQVLINEIKVLEDLLKRSQ